jgi:hypothetical protein
MVSMVFPAGVRRAGLQLRAGLTLVAAAALCISSAHSQGFFSHHKKDVPAPAPPSPKPGITSSQAPAFSIPVEPLGFFAPGAIYQGQRDSLVSLDFLDEDHLLFTFHAPGLIRREGNPTMTGDERQIRAVALALPQGTVTAEALWTLHDRGRYLWMLHDGHFLLRNENDLQLGGGSLELKALMHFPGSLLWLEMDPEQQWIVTNSREPADPRPGPGNVPSPTTASADILSDGSPPFAKSDIVLRILQRESGRVMLVSHVRGTLHLPINVDGYLETLRGKGREWVVNLNSFTGGSRTIGKVNSVCSPALEFISRGEVLVTTCNPDGGRWMVAMSTEGKYLWSAAAQSTQIWPRLVMAPNGLRMARETLLVARGVDVGTPLSFEDVKGQIVEVYDAADGRRSLMTQASPVLDGGGNVAISPSGRRVAVLADGAIQVFELPEPAPLPPAEKKPDAH